MQKSHLPSRFSSWLDTVDGRILSSFSKARQASRRAYSALKKLPPALRIGVGAGSGALSLLAWFLIASLVTTSAVKSLTPDIAEAAGVYTSASTDTDGNTQLAANSVTSSDTYNLDDTSADGSGDSSPDNQQKMGVDPNWRNGVTRNSGALKFDGVNDYALMPSAIIQANTIISAEAWFKTTATSQPILGAQSLLVPGAPVNFEVPLYIDSAGKLRGGFFTGVNGNIVSSAAVNDGLWHHAAIVSDGNLQSLYLDGAFVVTKSGSINHQSSSYNQIGAAYSVNNGVWPNFPTTGWAYFTGSIDEVRISNIARYNANFTPQRRFTEDANTAGLWHFDEASGQTIYDSSGNGKNGTLGAGSSAASDDPTRVDGAQAIMDGFKGCSPDDAADAACQAGGRSGAGNLTLGSNSSATDRKQYEVQMAPSSAVNFDGVNDYIVSPSASSLGGLGTSSVTIELWVKPNNAVNGRLFAYRLSGGGYIIVDRSVPQQAAYLHFSDGTANVDTWLSVDGALPVGSCMHLAFIIDRGANVFRLYKNGVSVGLNPTIGSANRSLGSSGTGQVSIGSDFTVPTSIPMAASMDEFKVSTGIGYSGSFTPPTRLKSDANTKVLWHLDENTGTTAYDASGNGNTGTLTNGPTWTTGVSRTDPAQGDPLYYQYRDVGNATWSTPVPASTTSTQLGSTGIYLKFNPAGVYSAYDHFLINSWAVEAFSTSSPQRGTRRSFPNRAHLVATSSGLDIIDASTNKLWMRLPTGSTMLGTSGIQSVTAKNGRVYVASTGSGNLTSIRFGSDGFGQYSTSGNAVGARTIANRALTSSYGTASGLALTANAPTDVSVQVLGTAPPKQYVAVADGSSGRVVLLGNETAQLSNPTTTSEGTAYTYDRAVSASTYTKVLLASDGTLYAGNSSAGGVDAWTSVQTDAANKTAATRTYTTSSSPALLSNTVNALSVTTGTSTAQSGSNTLAIGTSLGTNVIDEHSTQASGTVRTYVREGSTGTSGYSQKNFGGSLFTKLVTTNSVVKASMSSYSNSNVTIEMLYNPTTISPASSPHRFLYTNGGNCAGNNIEIILTSGSTPTICTQSSNATSVSALPSANIWYHLVFQITAGVPSIYVNGVRQTLVSTPTYASGTVSASTNVYIGARTSEAGAGCSQCTVAYYDEFRLSNTARYTSNFTPSKTPFTPDANTVALYHFDEVSGQTVYDSSSNANNGTLGADSATSTDDPTRIIPAIGGSSDKVTAVGLTKGGGANRAMQFDGVNDYILAGANNLPVGSSARTITSWFRVTKAMSANSYQTILNYGARSTNQSMFLLIAKDGVTSQTVRFYVSQFGDGVSCNSVTVDDGNWHSGITTFSSGVWTLYVDGVSCASKSMTTNTASGTNSSIGNMIGANAQLEGGIASVKVYNTALSATDVANLYNAERSGRSFEGYSGNLVGFWKLNERSGQTITDSSGSENNGTLGATSAVASDDPTPTIAGPATTTSPTLWVATNGAGADDGAVTAVSGAGDLQQKVYLTSNSNLPDLDVTSLSMDSGGLAFIGTESGGWSTGTGGSPELTNGVNKGALHITSRTRITGNTRVSK